MAKTLVMNFLNEVGKKTALRLSNVKDNVAEAEVIAAMDAIISNNIFETSGGDFKMKDSASVVDTSTTELVVR